MDSSATAAQPNRAKLLMFFRLEGEALPQFAQQLKALSEEEKDQLASEVQEHLTKTGQLPN